MEFFQHGQMSASQQQPNKNKSASRVIPSSSSESLLHLQINQFKRREQELKDEIERLHATVERLIHEKVELEVALKIHQDNELRRRLFIPSDESNSNNSQNV